MTWTHEQPTEPGWYPFRFSRYSEAWQVVKVYNDRHRKPTEYVLFAGGVHGQTLKQLCHAYPGCQWGSKVEEPGDKCDDYHSCPVCRGE